MGPLFGAVLAAYLDGVWERVGCPDEFTVVEVGAGRGALAVSVLAAEPRCRSALRYRTVERSARLREEQRELLRSRVEISDTLPSSPIVGVVLANELLDNLAPRILRHSQSGWSELFVDGGSELWVPCEDPPPVIRDAGEPGARLPWCEQARNWVETACGLVSEGAVLMIDYGVARTTELTHRQWLRTYREHQRGDDPLVEPGRFDITVDVAFDQLPEASAIMTQSEFLRRWGIGALVEQGRRIWTERVALGDLEAVRARSRVREAEALLDADGLGAFLVAEWVMSTDAGCERVVRPVGA